VQRENGGYETSTCCSALGVDGSDSGIFSKFDVWLHTGGTLKPRHRDWQAVEMLAECLTCAPHHVFSEEDLTDQDKPS